MNLQVQRACHRLIEVCKRWRSYAFFVCLAGLPVGVCGAGALDAAGSYDTLLEWAQKSKDERDKTRPVALTEKNNSIALLNFLRMVIREGEFNQVGFKYNEKNYKRREIGALLVALLLDKGISIGFSDLQGNLENDVDLQLIVAAWLFAATSHDKNFGFTTVKTFQESQRLLRTLSDELLSVHKEMANDLYNKLIKDTSAYYKLGLYDHTSYEKAIPCVQVLRYLAGRSGTKIDWDTLVSTFLSQDTMGYFAYDLTYLLSQGLLKEEFDDLTKQQILASMPILIISYANQANDKFNAFTRWGIVCKFMQAYLQRYPEETDAFCEIFDTLQVENASCINEYFYRELVNLLDDGVINAQGITFSKKTKQEIKAFKSTLQGNYFFKPFNSYDSNIKHCFYHSYLTATDDEVSKIFYPTWFFTLTMEDAQEYWKRWRDDRLASGFLREQVTSLPVDIQHLVFQFAKDVPCAVDKAIRYIRRSEKEDKARVTKHFYDKKLFQKLQHATQFGHVSTALLTLDEVIDLDLRVIETSPALASDIAKRIKKAGVETVALQSADYKDVEEVKKANMLRYMVELVQKAGKKAIESEEVELGYSSEENEGWKKKRERRTPFLLLETFAEAGVFEDESLRDVLKGDRNIGYMIRYFYKHRASVLKTGRILKLIREELLYDDDVIRRLNEYLCLMLKTSSPICMCYGSILKERSERRYLKSHLSGIEADENREKLQALMSRLKDTKKDVVVTSLGNFLYWCANLNIIQRGMLLDGQYDRITLLESLPVLQLRQFSSEDTFTALLKDCGTDGYPSILRQLLHWKHLLLRAGSEGIKEDITRKILFNYDVSKKPLLKFFNYHLFLHDTLRNSAFYDEIMNDFLAIESTLDDQNNPFMDEDQGNTLKRCLRYPKRRRESKGNTLKCYLRYHKRRRESNRLSFIEHLSIMFVVEVVMVGWVWYLIKMPIPAPKKKRKALQKKKRPRKMRGRSHA